MRNKSRSTIFNKNVGDAFEVKQLSMAKMWKTQEAFHLMREIKKMNGKYRAAMTVGNFISLNF